jgi:hypothetical protein
LTQLNNLTDYEKIQVADIEAWKNLEPSVVSQAFDFVAYPATWLIQKTIPGATIQRILTAANLLAHGITDTGNILNEGGVCKICDLKNKNLLLSDEIANRIHNSAIGIAVAEGGVTGTAGIFGLVVDIPAIITLALRTIHKVGLCYGYECYSEMEKNFVLGILSASSANSMSEKVAAITTLSSIQVAIAKQTWKKVMGETTAVQELSKGGSVIAARTLAKQLGVNITKRKALQMIPVFGAGVGASVNGWYIKDVGWAARRTFQERWLIENKKLTEMDQ